MGNNNGRFSDGFLMGALVGGAAVFLLGTEKGNKVLKVILEEGRAGFSDLMNEIDEYREEIKEEMVEEEKELQFVEEDEEVDKVVETAKVPSGSAPSASPKPKSSTKRFFRKK